MSQAERSIWDDGFWAGISAMIIGAAVAIAVILHLRPKPRPAESVDIQLGKLQGGSRAVGFYTNRPPPRPPTPNEMPLPSPPELGDKESDKRAP